MYWLARGFGSSDVKSFSMSRYARTCSTVVSLIRSLAKWHAVSSSSSALRCHDDLAQGVPVQLAEELALEHVSCVSTTLPFGCAVRVVQEHEHLTDDKEMDAVHAVAR